MPELSYLLPKIIRKIFNKCAVRNSHIDKTARLDTGSIVSDSEMGRYSYIGEHTSMLYTKVGNFTSISNYCAIGGGAHPIDWVSTSPMFNRSGGILKTKFSSNEYNPFALTKIGNDVWIGANSLIKAGVIISDGAVVGMGSVVTKDIGPYEIWAGNPAKYIRKRFDEETIKKLLEIKWWDWEDQILIKYSEYFNDPEQFLRQFSQKKY